MNAVLARSSVLGLALLIVGCSASVSTPRPQPVASPAAQAELRLATAQRAVTQGEPAAAAAIYEQLVRERNGQAQVLLAGLLLRGIGVQRDPERAIGLLQEAIAQNVPEAPRQLGDVYWDGDGVPPDRERALQLYRLGITLGDELATFRLASLTLEDEEASPEAKRVAIEDVRRAARGGIVQAQLTLGELYADGKLGRKDPIEAARWYAVALEPLRAEAKAGDARSQERMGDMLRDGKGTRADGLAALDWYQRAAANGRLPAVMRLVRLHERGAAGLPADPTKAVRWLQIAAERGDRVAMYDLARRKFQGDDVAVDKSGALDLFVRAAELGENRAYRWVGEILEDDPRHPNYLEAAAWYRRAAKTGDGKAMFKLAELYEKARLGSADAVEAMIWYQLADEHGYERGAERVARLDRKLQASEKERAALEVVKLRPTLGGI